ncbi:MAG: DUF1636 family protein [Pelagimonas sp.]|uniref:DUF1636 family protein n=1 Tax=Pelagimonas sp. TaxID=2073170 RepID=UPI003D6BEAE2
MADVTLMVCTTCRAGAPTDDTGPRAGAQLFDALNAQNLPSTVTLRPVECLSACTRGCSMVLSGGPQRWTYVYGDLNANDHVEDIVSGVAAYAETQDGIVPWRQRPVIFRKQSLARIPPQETPND